MPQIFHRSFNVLSRVSIFGAIFFLAALGWVAAKTVRAPYYTGAFTALEQPVPYFRSERFKALVQDLRGRYDIVLVDLPPVGLAADALLVAPLVDGTILVLSAPATRKDDAARAKRLIRDAGGKLAGCVLNKATVTSRGYYYYSAEAAVATE